MASRRQQRKIGEKKRRKSRAATMKKRIVKKSSASAPQDDEHRRREKRTCGVCGAGRIHYNHHFCPYNYSQGVFGLRTCRERCPPGRHRLLLASASGSGNHHQLRRLVRVTNVPLSAIPGERELRGLFRRFGPLARCELTRVRRRDHVGFGWVVFENREHAEEAINKLNGQLVGDRRLRVDWAYPR